VFKNELNSEKLIFFFCFETAFLRILNALWLAHSALNSHIAMIKCIIIVVIIAGIDIQQARRLRNEFDGKLRDQLQLADGQLLDNGQKSCVSIQRPVQ